MSSLGYSAVASKYSKLCLVAASVLLVCTASLGWTAIRQPPRTWLPTIQFSNEPECVEEVFSEAWKNGTPAVAGFEGEQWLDSPQECLALAHWHVEPDEEFTSTMQPSSRTLPPKDPPLSAHNWVGQAEKPAGWPIVPEAGCPRTISQVVSVKIYKGVMYINPPNNDTSMAYHTFWRPVRELIIEMLLGVMWLYKDLGDVDFLLHYGDYPKDCNVTMPVLQYSIVNTTSPSTGKPIGHHPDQLVCSGMGGPVPPGCPHAAKGYTVAHYDAWNGLAVSPQQLLWYSYCIHRRAQRRLNASSMCGLPRKPSVLWRGTPTGGNQGWDITHAEWQAQKIAQAGDAQPLMYHLLNKRLALSLMRLRYPWIDTGLTDFWSWPTDIKNETLMQSAVGRALWYAVKADHVPLERWADTQFQVQIDGHGYSARSNRLLLQGSTMVKVESIMREWYVDAMVPGVHWETVQYDLSDFAARTKQLVDEAKHSTKRFDRMAARNLKMGVKRYNAFAQIEALAWSVARMKEASPWEVLPPTEAAPPGYTGPVEQGWHVVKFAKDRKWVGVIMNKYHDRIMQMFPHNFE